MQWFHIPEIGGVSLVRYGGGGGGGGSDEGKQAQVPTNFVCWAKMFCTNIRSKRLESPPPKKKKKKNNNNNK